MIYVYILKSKIGDGHYIGITKNIQNRLKEHNRGKVRSTKKRRPLILIYSETFKSYNEARIREKEIKSYKGGNSFKSLLKRG